MKAACTTCDRPSRLGELWRKAIGRDKWHRFGTIDRAGDYDLGALGPWSATTVAQPSKPAISGIGFPNCRNSKTTLARDPSELKELACQRSSQAWRRFWL